MRVICHPNISRLRYNLDLYCTETGVLIPLCNMLEKYYKANINYNFVDDDISEKLEAEGDLLICFPAKALFEFYKFENFQKIWFLSEAHHETLAVRGIPNISIMAGVPPVYVANNKDNIHSIIPYVELPVFENAKENLILFNLWYKIKETDTINVLNKLSDIASRHKDCKFHIINNSDEYPDDSRCIEEYQRDNIIITGRLAHHQICQLMSRAKIIFHHRAWTDNYLSLEGFFYKCNYIAYRLPHWEQFHEGYLHPSNSTYITDINDIETAILAAFSNDGMSVTINYERYMLEQNYFRRWMDKNIPR